MRKSFADDLTVHERCQLGHGVRLLQADEPFAAHECFEAVFRQTHGPVRTLFRAMTQLSASYYQLQLGRGRAARSTLNKALRNLSLVEVLSNEFQLSVEKLFDDLGVREDGPRFVSRCAHDLPKCWPVPETLHQALSFAGHVSEERVTQDDKKVTAVGFNEALGLQLLESSAQQVVAEVVVTSHHHQPWGIVHGGVYCSIVETVCSIGAQLAIAGSGGFIVGVDNHTSFLKATRAGTLRATARPLAGGRRTQLWEANIENERGELVATGRVRLMAVEAGKTLVGETAALKNR